MVKDARGKLSQEAFAEKTGISRSTIANLESGITKFPKKDTREKLIAKAGLSAEEMFRAAGHLEQTDEIDIMAEFRRILAIEDLNAQMAALDELPEEAFDLVEIMAHRVLQNRLRLGERSNTAK